MRTTPMEVKRRRFTVHDYHRMGEAGILHEDDRVELIEGEIVEMAAIGTTADCDDIDPYARNRRTSRCDYALIYDSESR